MSEIPLPGRDSVEAQRELFRLAAKDQGLTIDVIAQRSPLKISTMKGWRDGATEWYWPTTPLLNLISRVQSRGQQALLDRLAARKRLAQISRNQSIRIGLEFDRNAKLLIHQLCAKHGFKTIAQVAGQSINAVKQQNIGAFNVGALSWARIGSIEPDAVSSLFMPQRMAA